MMNKFENFPSVNMTSLRESFDRRALMKVQFRKYGITKYNFYMTDRWVDIQQNYNITGKYIHLSSVIGTVVSHLNSIRNWYISTNEEYAIFCDDDTSFETSEYWNFTWNEFVENLPTNWECVQLLRGQMPPSIVGPESWDSCLKILYGRWWGVCCLIRRSYAKKLLDRYFINYNTLNLSIADWYDENWIDANLIEYVENVLFLGRGIVHNFPLFVDALNTESTYANTWNFDDDEEIKRIRDPWIITRKTFLDLWKKNGKDLNLKEALTI